jgi:hypothetical protein
MRVVSVDMPILPLQFRRLKKFFLKDPCLLKSKKRFWAAKQLSMWPDWINCPTLAKNMIAGGSLSGFFLIPVVTFPMKHKKIRQQLLSKKSAILCTIIVSRIFLYADTGEN